MNYVDIKQRTVGDWEQCIRQSSTRCQQLITNVVNQSFIGKLPLSTSQHNLLEAALNTGDL